MAISEALELEDARRCDIAHLGHKFAVEAGLHLDLAGQIELLRLRLESLVPLFEDLAEACGVDLDKLLQLGQILFKVAEAFEQRDERRRVARDHIVANGAIRQRDEMPLLSDERRETRAQLRLFLQIKRIDLLELALQAEEERGLVHLQLRAG